MNPWNLEELSLANRLARQVDDLILRSPDFQTALQRALQRAQKALQIREKVLGDLHPCTIDSFKDVGALLLDLGRAEEALPVILREVTSIEGVYGADSMEYSHGMSLLARCHEAMGNYREAITCRRLQIAIQAREDEVGCANLTKISMARCLHKIGSSGEAILLLEDARSILKDPRYWIYMGELRAYEEMVVIVRDLDGKKGMGDLFKRIVSAVERFDGRQKRRAPKQLMKIAKVYAEAGLKEIAGDIEALGNALIRKYP